MKLRLVDNWFRVHTFGTVRASAFGAILSAGMAAAAKFLFIWEVLPEEIKSFMPYNWRTPFVLSGVFLCIIAARYFTTTPPETENGN